ncbi:MAG TPA: DUF998 domain-containing protein [Acidimicrobiales bacterium]|jgi:hypothetical protein|nr:DUF998 domain-containing protein [Acidimicrobiales bacterium]
MASFAFHPSTQCSRVQARVSFYAAGLFVLVLTLLHAVKHDLSPTWHVISEYEIGDHGWLMSIAFLSWAVSCLALAASLRPHITTRGGTVGLVLLLVTAVGMVLAALGTSDPITATKDELTTHGKVHGFGALLGIPGLLLAATFISRSLSRNPAWAHARRWLIRTTVFAWLSLAVYGVAMITMYDAEYGPDVKIGWPNRLIVATYCAWLMTTAAAAARIAAQRVAPQPARSWTAWLCV